MKRFAIFCISNVTAIWIASYLLTGFEVTGGFVAYLFLAAAVAALAWLAKPIINFFTLPINFLTSFLIGLVLTFALLYVFKMIVPGYGITSGLFLGIETSYFEIRPWNVGATATTGIAAVVFSLMTSFVDWLLDSPL